MSNTEIWTVHKQKLDCALQLARTVSADFNNALTGILGHTSHLLIQLEPGHPMRESLLEIQKAAERAAEVASNLAAFSQQDKDVKPKQSGNLNSVVEATIDLFNLPANEKVQWNSDLSKKLFSANFDEAKIQQALIKLLDNSFDAMDRSGTISIRTTNCEFSELVKDANVQVPPGVYVAIEITDSGSGIAPANLSRAFEPFFTTKSPPHRGLGLAFVYGIVSNHSGRVAILSEEGKGTTVRIYLPAQRELAKDRSHKFMNLRGTQTILLIDDESYLLTMSETILTSYGYRVLTTDSARKGIELYRSCSDHIDLVMTDLVMPEMSGREVIEQLRRDSPNVRVILTSGVMGTGIEGNEQFLQKPFTALDLLRQVKQALHSP